MLNNEKEITLNEAGTRQMYFEGELVYACNYCSRWFHPSRRVSQKYCCESCRVLACRHRHKVLQGVVSGGSLYQRNKTTNTDLKDAIIEIQSELLKNQREANQRLFDVQMDMQNKLSNDIDSIESKVEIKTQKIIDRQAWHMFLTVVAPLIAPPIKEFFTSLSNTKEDFSLESIKEMLSKQHSIPDGMKDQVMKVAEEYMKDFTGSSTSKK